MENYTEELATGMAEVSLKMGKREKKISIKKAKKKLQNKCRYFRYPEFTQIKQH
jgi:hypothetical protein